MIIFYSGCTGEKRYRLKKNVPELIVKGATIMLSYDAMRHVKADHGGLKALLLERKRDHLLQRDRHQPGAGDPVLPVQEVLDDGQLREQ